MKIALLVLAGALALCALLYPSDPHRAQRAILKLLADGRWWYGLDMVEASNGDLQRGVIYVWLARLEEDGLVQRRMEPEPCDPGFPRHQFRISGAGRRELERLEATETVSLPDLVTA